MAPTVPALPPVLLLASAAAINWEDAACLAVSGNNSAPVIDGPPEQLHVTFGKNRSSCVVSWISQLTFRNFSGFEAAEPFNKWVVLNPGNHGQTYRPCLVQSHAEWARNESALGSNALRASGLDLESSPSYGCIRF